MSVKNPHRKVVNCEYCGRDTRSTIGVCARCSGNTAISDEKDRKLRSSRELINEVHEDGYDEEDSF